MAKPSKDRTNARPRKRTYKKPKLKRHGTIEDITQSLGSPGHDGPFGSTVQP